MANVYGFCPLCGAPGVERERRPGGNDECERGHAYPSSKAIPADARAEAARRKAKEAQP